jgi:hypothetical protein
MYCPQVRSPPFAALALRTARTIAERQQRDAPHHDIHLASSRRSSVTKSYQKRRRFMQSQVKSLSFRLGPLVAAALAAMVMLVLATAALADRPANAPVYPTTAKLFGKSYAQWSAQWWKWALARPVEGHPFSEPGFDCNSANNGQSGPVWFLALSALEDPLVERSCTIPADKAVFIGLANAECSDLEGLGATAAEQRDCAKFFADHIVVSSLFCTIDGQAVANLDAFRFLSPQFTFSAPTPWIFGNTGGTGTAVSDGYFLMLRPLSSGSHTLRCGGAFHFSVAEGDPFDADFGFGNTYHLTVKE